MNESITKDTILLWDEPENSISPKYSSILVDAILEMQRYGVQSIIATHDYMLAKSFEVRKKAEDSVRFHSLQKDGEKINYEYNENFRDLKENPIITAYDDLLDEVIRLNMGD